MGTRHLICVVKDGKYKIAQYGQWDGYPSGQGTSILDFLKSGNVFKLRQKVDSLTWITDEEHKARWEECGADGSGRVDMETAERFKQAYPELSRDTGAGVLDCIVEAEHPLKLYNRIEFAQDSLFCEWAYVLDLDNDTLEVYKGFNRTQVDPSERFYREGYKSHSGDQYYPVRFVASFPFADLPAPEIFCEALEEVEAGND